ncbi:Gfo/Idh/MocA family oxidoreductase [uncultured Pseudodesulfovibrio sp.]|uniref:Gfo/Idh/MocA family protein n=1 Tax=uncultured Pseudodesulfovibrio sp. TaxID=2035858 RepID=UPI0029C6A7FD|nr:Gfo/Idh/MocA family oxidoreductase [uncultured Pseudodesulfovibrio sp.]
MLNAGVIGYGYWGPNLVRNFMECEKSLVLKVSDLDPARLALCKSRYPSIQTTGDYREILNDPAIDAVVIATPVGTHYPLALEALQAGKHVWVEKPFTSTVEQGETLLNEAEKRGLKIIVDHTFIYTGAVKKIKSLVDEGAFGNIYYYDSVRINLGLFQQDVDVLWDLAVHDFSILHYLFGKKPTGISAIGKSHVAGKPENTAFVSLMYDDNFIAHINANWLSPVKVRQILIGGDKKMAVFNDLEQAEKLKIYDSGLVLDNQEDIRETMIGYRTGDMLAPKIPTTEALKDEVEHFIHCIDTGEEPITSGAMGLEMVRLLCLASESIKQQGAPLEVK